MLAILYDVHGNLPALEAVLADVEAAGADRLLLGGDYTAMGAWPAESAERLEALDGATWIRGNWERWVADPGEIEGEGLLLAARDFVIAALGTDRVARHGALRESTALDGTLYCHASPRSDMEPFAAQADGRDLGLLQGIGERRVVVGHTHVQFRRITEDGIEVVNPGSVGMPLDGDRRAAYALLGDDGIELRRVAYDDEAAAAALDAIESEWSRLSARRIREARFDV